MVKKFFKDNNVKCDEDSCNSQPTITDAERGEMFCGGCGLVLTEKIEDENSEHTSYTQEEYLTQTRTGPATSLTMHDRGLSTVIGQNKDSSGHALSGRAKAAFYRLRTWDQRTKSRSKNRNLSQAFILLNGIKTKLGIPEMVVENTAYLYRKAASMNLARGRSIAPLISAALYAACRETNTPRTLDDISDAGNVSRKSLSRTYRTLVRRLDLNLNQYDTAGFVTRIANILEVKEKTKRDALDILQKSQEKEISAGKNPVAQATASLYLASLLNGETLSQTAFSKASGVSSVTIRNRVTSIKEILKL
ncbi:MAG: transcription initiation factor B [Marine Group I thaumarchaeote]|nr:MAG: transcription initiation factor B [Marine Group I thaumarchaeote]